MEHAVGTHTDVKMTSSVLGVIPKLRTSPQNKERSLEGKRFRLTHNSGFNFADPHW